MNVEYIFSHTGQILLYFHCKTSIKSEASTPALRLVHKALGIEEKLRSIDHTIYSVAFYLQLLCCRGCGSKCRGLYSPVLRLPYAGLLYARHHSGAKQLTWLAARKFNFLCILLMVRF